MPVRSRIEVFGIPIPTTSKVIAPRKNIFNVVEEDEQHAAAHKGQNPKFQLTIPNQDQIELVRGGYVQRRAREEINDRPLWFTTRRGRQEGYMIKRRLYWKDK